MENERKITQNRKARHDFFILSTQEAGIALQGTEVKSLREGRLNLKDSYAKVKNGEVFLIGMHISPYEQGNINNHDPERVRKLLLHSREIERLRKNIEEKGLTVVPLSLYFKNGRVKVELALAKGKHSYDKRADNAERDAVREMDRARKNASDHPRSRGAGRSNET
jgi:SsrA-binding protein